MRPAIGARSTFVEARSYTAPRVRRPREVPVARGDRLTVHIDGFGDGPDGIAREGDYVIFVPGVLPGERVEIDVTSAARKFGRGELVAVHAASSEPVSYTHLTLPTILRV